MLKSGTITPKESLAFLAKAQIVRGQLYEAQKLGHSEDLKKLRETTKEFFLSENVNLDAKLLKNYLVTNPSFEDVLLAFGCFDKRNEKPAPASVAVIPLRFQLFEGNIDNSFEIVDRTVGSKKYARYQSQLKNRRRFVFLGSTFAGLGSLEVVLRIFFPLFDTLKLQLMLLAYIGNMTLLSTMSFGDKSSPKTTVRFAKGIMPWEWFTRADELSFCNRILEVDAELYGENGYGTRESVDRLFKRGMTAREPEQEVMIQQYWMSGGDGFLWCEPDQDPAELVWHKFMESKRLRHIEEQDLVDKLIE